MKLFFSIILTLFCFHTSLYQLVSDHADYRLYRDYYPGLKIHQFNYAQFYCKVYGVDLKYVMATMNQESGFHDLALSSCGAIGSMQVMACNLPKNPESLKDPEVNIKTGIRVLRDNLILTRGNYAMALAKYHAGPNYDLRKYRWWGSYVLIIHVNAQEAV